MSAISLKSITGITSITTHAGVDDQLTLHNNNTTERVKIDVAGNVHINNQLAVTGVTTFSDRVIISGGKDLQLLDNGVIRLGNDSNSADFQMFHDGSHTRFNNGTGNTYITNTSTNGSIRLSPKAGEEGLIVRYQGAVQAYHSNTKRIETTNTGAVVTGIATVSTRLNINTVSNARLAVAGTNYAWRGQFMIKDTTTGASAMPYMTFWDGSEANDGSNTGLLGRAGHVNGGGINERFDFWTYRSTTPLSLGTNGYERLRILPAGQTLITTNINGNTISARTVLSNYTPTLQIEGNSKSSTSASLTANVNNAVGPSLWFAKTRGTSLGSNTVAQSGDELGTIVFNGADGTDIQTMGSYIRGVVDGSVSSNNVPGRLQFHTATGGTMYERLRIDSNGRVLIGTTNSDSVGSIDQNVVIGSTTNNEEVALTLNVIEGNNNRRAKFFLDDNDGVFGIDATASTGVPAFVVRSATSEKLRITQNGKVLIGSDTHNTAIGSGVGSQLQVEGNSYATSSLALINNQSATDPAFLVFGKSRAGSSGGATVVQNGDRLGGIRWCGADGSDLHSRAAQVDVYVDGTPGGNDMPGRMTIETTPDGSSTPTNHLILYGTSKEVRNAGHYVAQTSGSGTSSQQASFGATQAGMSASSYNYILSGSNDGGNKCVLFVNGSSRSTDGGTNALTLRNDGGNLNLGNSATNTIIHGTVTFPQSIGNQQNVFRYDNAGGVGAYLSLQNRSSTANTAVGIAFGVDNSDASMTSSDYANGQIKVRNDGSGGGIMSFNVHTGGNFEALKIVGNIHNRRNSTNGNSTAMQGGVAFSAAGIAIDKSWDNYPGIHVFNTTGHSDTNQGEFRFHGWNTSYNSYPLASGSDFSVNLVADGSGLTSDERRKTGISTITNALNTVSQLRGVKYTQVNRELKPQTHMTMDNGQKLGFVAQEVIPHLPSIVIDSGDHVQPMENGYCDRYKIDYGSVVALLTEAVKELKSKNEALEARIATLEGS